jgi:phage gp29-like protein
VFAGYLRDLGEYNPDLGGLSAFRIYEQMRRSDAQVAATLAGMKLALRSAEWAVAEPADASAVEKEAAGLIRECLFEELDLDAAIENALLMLDFGCSAHEDVWYVDGNRVRLKKLAARHPSTFSRWIVDAEENLTAIEQYGAKADSYVTVQLPVEKAALFTFQQEGANFAGRSLLRAMYEEWYIKHSLYKIDAIACERNGMGVPTIVMGLDAKREDRAAALDWVRKLCVHERTGLVLPNGWTFSLEGVKGTLRDPKESIAQHNIAISNAGLAQFLMLGQTETGSRALGQTMSDFFYLSLEATAKKIGRVMTLATIRRLVDYNFGVDVRCPKLVAQNILAVKFEALHGALKDLAGAELVRPDDELEAYLRKKLGLPEAGAARPLTKPAATKVQMGEGAAIRSPAEAGDGTLKRAPQVSREPRGAEKFLALAEIVGELDRGRDEIAAALRRAKSAVQAEIVHKLINAPLPTMHRVSVAPDEKLVSQVEAVLGQVYEFGVRQVEEEAARQRDAKTAAQVRMADRKGARDPLGVYADAVVGEFQNDLQSRAANVALDWRRRPGDLTTGEIIRKVDEELDGQSDKWIDGVASKGTNEAFADGRADGYEQHAEEIASVIYSALLDVNTCENCAAADGEEGATPDDITDAPNPDCDGGDKCRCVHVYVFGDEVRQ